MGSAASGRPVSIELVQRTERLLREGRGPKELADELGIDWGTVRKIQLGRHPAQAKLRAAARCPGCGGLVLEPAKGCAVCACRRDPAGLQPGEPSAVRKAA